MEFMQVPRSQNSEADEVAKQASLEDRTDPLDLKVELQRHPSIDELHDFEIQS